jgi:hypothetical protein
VVGDTQCVVPHEQNHPPGRCIAKRTRLAVTILASTFLAQEMYDSGSVRELRSARVVLRFRLWRGSVFRALLFNCKDGGSQSRRNLHALIVLWPIGGRGLWWVLSVCENLIFSHRYEIQNVISFARKTSSPIEKADFAP